MNKKIKSINARHILDSRANPTIEVDVTTSDNIIGRAAVPSGASTGALEAHELRDNDSFFNGMGVNKAIENVKTIISDSLVGMDVTDQDSIDDMLIEIDGTDNKNNLGANAILAVSMATMRASANQQNKQLFELFPNIYGPSGSTAINSDSIRIGSTTRGTGIMTRAGGSTGKYSSHNSSTSAMSSILVICNSALTTCFSDAPASSSRSFILSIS